jgi:uncharacterized membrane protein YeaQ/YmgE (transglycosylase-associated protein family)
MSLNLMMMIGIWVILGVIIAALAESIFKGERPYGVANDYVISIVATVLTGFADWYIVPLFFSGQTILFIAAVLEPPLVALFCLWIARKIKSRQ